MGDGGREGMCGGGGGGGDDGDVRGTLGGGQQAALNDQAWNMSGSLLLPSVLMLRDLSSRQLTSSPLLSTRGNLSSLLCIRRVRRGPRYSAHQSLIVAEV